MTREQAINICESLGVNPNDTDEIALIVNAVADIDFGDGEHATPEQLNELCEALERLRNPEQGSGVTPNSTHTNDR